MMCCSVPNAPPNPILRVKASFCRAHSREKGDTVAVVNLDRKDASGSGIYLRYTTE